MHPLENSAVDPAFNLGLEETLLLAESDDYFLLWQNSPAIIIGRHQHPESEIDLELAEKDKIEVKRRISGGGAVYHDQGNINFSFIETLKEKSLNNIYNFSRYLAPVCRALKRLGIQSSISGRNDIVVAGRKVSGCAQIIAGRRILCHGTLLIDADIAKMAQYLRPSKQKVQAHGVSSVRSRVGNLCDYWSAGSTIAGLKKYLIEECIAVSGIEAAISASTCQIPRAIPDISQLPSDIIHKATQLAKTKYCNDAWNFGFSFRQTGEMRRRFPFGEVELRWRIENSKIAEFAIYGDFFGIKDCAELAEYLQGIEYARHSIRQSLLNVDFTKFFSGCDSREMRSFFEQCSPV